MIWAPIFGQNAPKASYNVRCIAFYNLENLFDTIPGRQQGTNDSDFAPNSPKRWNSERYWEKLGNLASVISQLGDEFPQLGPPAIVGISEVENINPLRDLVRTDALKAFDYQIVHYDSPDRRGIDVGLLYRPDLFTVTNHRSVRLSVPENPDFRTRDQLVVSGLLMGERIHIIVNHWPSRSGGEKRSRPLRIAAGKLCRSIVDSIQRVEPQAKIVIMGDLNDDPSDESIRKALGAKKRRMFLKSNDLFNTMYSLYTSGIGTLAYHDAWNLFDNIIISEPLLNAPDGGMKFHNAKVFNRSFLINKRGQYKGYPFRTYSGSTYQGGYSDHFPVYIFVVKQKK